MKLLKIMLCIFVLIWLPSALGICVFPACGVSSAPRRGMTEDGVSGSEKAAGCPDAAEFLLCMLAGNLLMWAVFEAVAVPCAFGGAALHTVLLIWSAVIAAILLGCSLKRRIFPVFRFGHRERMAGTACPASDHPAGSRRHDAEILFYAAAALAAVLILLQCAVYIGGMHLDQDDSRYIAEAVDAWENDRIYAVLPQSGSVRTGAWSGDFIKDLVSPWPLWIAAASKLTMMHPATFAHTVCAAYLLLLFYACVYLIGRELFRDSREKPMIFLAVSAFIMMFFAGSLRTSAEFTLLRIWQGKSVFAGVGTAALLLEFLMLYRYAEKPGYGSGEKKVFLLVLLTGAASCLMSGMGVILSLIMIAAFSLWYLIAYRRIRGFLILMLDCLPGIVMGMMTILLHGVTG